jgi:hypothetical protein
MWFKKKETPREDNSVAPPWEHIDTIPKKPSIIKRFDLVEFVMYGTGFGKWGARFLLLGFAAAILFLSYVLYVSPSHNPPLPPEVDRPALDQYASSTPFIIGSTTRS